MLIWIGSSYKLHLHIILISDQRQGHLPWGPLFNPETLRHIAVGSEERYNMSTCHPRGERQRRGSIWHLGSWGVSVCLVMTLGRWGEANGNINTVAWQDRGCWLNSPQLPYKGNLKNPQHRQASPEEFHYKPRCALSSWCHLISLGLFVFCNVQLFHFVGMSLWRTSRHT